jgi:hypothetical protein
VFEISINKYMIDSTLIKQHQMSLENTSRGGFRAYPEIEGTFLINIHHI